MRTRDALLCNPRHSSTEQPLLGNANAPLAVQKLEFGEIDMRYDKALTPQSLRYLSGYADTGTVDVAWQRWATQPRPAVRIEYSQGRAGWYATVGLGPHTTSVGPSESKHSCKQAALSQLRRLLERYQSSSR